MLFCSKTNAISTAEKLSIDTTIMLENKKTKLTKKTKSKQKLSATSSNPGCVCYMHSMAIISRTIINL